MDRGRFFVAIIISGSNLVLERTFKQRGNMCWRDNERNYKAERASRELAQMRRDNDAKGKEWALRATPAQKRAAKSVSLLFAILPLVLHIRKGHSDPFTLLGNEEHESFHLFATKIGLKGVYYRQKMNVSPAVVFSNCLSGIHNPDDPHSTIASLMPTFKENLARDWKNCLAKAKELGVTTNKKTLLDAGEAFLDAIWHR